MIPLLKIENLTVGYGRMQVLRNVDLQINKNDFIGIVGPNGGGKTTLLKAILGLLQPTEGKITYSNGGKMIGYLPQVKNIDRKFPISVADVVRSGLMLRKEAAHDEKPKIAVEKILAETGISAIRNKSIGEISGGQLQRAFLCRAIISNPEILLLDEPDSFIDNHFEAELYEMLKELNKKMAILLVSHEVETISGLVKSIAFVDGGLHYHSNAGGLQGSMVSARCPVCGKLKNENTNQE